jgi:RNA polymerase sigma-70 factor (ECF subfamily)
MYPFVASAFRRKLRRALIFRLKPEATQSIYSHVLRSSHPDTGVLWIPWPPWSSFVKYYGESIRSDWTPLRVSQYTNHPRCGLQRRTDIIRDVHRGVMDADRQEMERLAAGDGSAIGGLYDRHGASVYSLASRILSNRADAEDVVQEVFAQAWTDARRYDPERGAVATWLLVMTRSRAIDRLRSRQTAVDARGSELDPRDPHPGQEVDVITAEQVERVKKVLGELPVSQRTAIELAYYEGLSQAEIAARLQEPLGTVKTRVRTGLLKLRAALLGK